MEISDAIAIVAQDPSVTGIFTDFDGTLSPIVPLPGDAVAAEGALEALAALAKKFNLVSVVSARSLEDLRHRARAPGVLLAGAYGRERSDRKVRRSTEGWETIGVAAIGAIGALEGVRLERKGTGVALHFRGAEQHADALREVAESLAREFSLELRPGRMVFDLMVPGPGKGEAIQALIAERSLSRVLVAGDDIADVEAFAMLRTLDVESVIVGVASDEAPADLGEHADLVVEGPQALARLFSSIASAV
jgi:trehalose 6-phosphate phosphatase